MYTFTRNSVIRTIKITAGIAAIGLAGMYGKVSATDVELPNAAEVQYFSPEAQQFYSAGIIALDKIDYDNASSMLSKAAALQPTAIRLNHIAATLAIYQGRQNTVDKARDYYATALSEYENILRVPTISGDLRRQITNEMKSAQLEQENLAQRDVIREASGTSYMIEYSRKYGDRPKRKAGETPAATPSTTITQEMLSPFFNPVQQQPGGQPGFGPPQPGAFPGEGGGGFPQPQGQTPLL